MMKKDLTTLSNEEWVKAVAPNEAIMVIQQPLPPYKMAKAAVKVNHSGPSQLTIKGMKTRL